MLMVVVQTLQFLGIFKYLAFSLTKRVHDTRLLIGVIVLIAFFSSMLVTNDVSIITLIPLLALSISKTAIDPIFPVILLCLAANLGSLLTPMGNPQNLFLFIHYNLTIKKFFTDGFAFESSEFIAFRNHVWDYQATKNSEFNNYYARFE